MRQYPRSLVIGQGERIRVHNELEEYNAGLKGYERHRDPEINKLQKGTDKEVLRVRPIVEHEEVDEKAKEMAMAEARAELKAEARAAAQAVLDEEANEKTINVVKPQDTDTQSETIKETIKTNTEGLTRGQKAAATRKRNQEARLSGKL